MRGRPRQSTATRDAKGNPGHRARVKPPTAKSAPTKSKGRGPAPASNVRGGTPRELTVAGKRVWAMVVPQLDAVHFYDPLDRNALARYCDSVAQYWDVTRQLRKQKFTYEVPKVGGGKMLRFNPLFMIQDRLARRLDTLEDRFGMTTRSRHEIMWRLANQVPQLPFGTADDASAPAPDSAKKSPIGILNPSSEDGPRRVH